MSAMTSSGSELEPAGYAELLAGLKARVRATRFRAARAANAGVLGLYWSVGRDILEGQRVAGWGQGRDVLGRGLAARVS
jgi:hypothetical protein